MKHNCAWLWLLFAIGCARWSTSTSNNKKKLSKMTVFERHLLHTFTFQIVCMIEKLSVFNQMLQIQFLLFFSLRLFLFFISSQFLFFSFYFLSELKLLKYSNFLKANLHLLEDVNGFKNKKNPISFGWLVGCFAIVWSSRFSIHLIPNNSNGP